MRKSLSLHALIVLLFSFSLFSCQGEGENLSIPGVDGPHVKLVKDNVMITMVLENLALDGGGRFAIPDFYDSYVEVSPDLQSEGTMLSFSVKVDDIIDRHVDFEEIALPGGRPLPGVASGKLPAVAFSIDALEDVRFYLGKEVFGVWVPRDNLNLEGGIITSRFYAGGTRAGNLSMVGKDENGENAGFLLLLDMKGKIKKKLKKAKRRY